MWAPLPKQGKTDDADGGLKTPPPRTRAPSTPQVLISGASQPSERSQTSQRHEPSERSQHPQRKDGSQYVYDVDVVRQEGMRRFSPAGDSTRHPWDSANCLKMFATVLIPNF